MLNVWTMMTDIHCFAHASFEDSCITRCKWFIVIVSRFLADGFWYETCTGILHSKCCSNSMNKKGFALQCVSLFKFSEIHRQKSSFIAFVVQAYCVLHVQLVFCLCQEAFNVRFRSRHQEVVDVSSCLLFNLFLTRFETIEQATVAS